MLDTFPAMPCGVAVQVTEDVIIYNGFDVEKEGKTGMILRGVAAHTLLLSLTLSRLRYGCSHTSWISVATGGIVEGEIVDVLEVRTGDVLGYLGESRRRRCR